MRNDRFLQALNGENQGRPPVWLMRQAGRYMPEYRALRSHYSFLEMCRQPELIAEVTQLPIHAFDMDAAILFSDILLVVDTFNRGLSFDEGKGPVIAKPLKSLEEVERLSASDVNESLGYVSEGIKMLKKALNVPLIGFCGAPFTIASYMIEGGSSRDLLKTKKWLLNHPENFHLLLEQIVSVTVDYIHLQVDAGVQAFQIFDSWANYLSWSQFEEFSYAYMKKLVDVLKKRAIPVILYCRGSSVFAPKLAEATPQGISLDWNCNLAEMRKHIPFHIAIQGNLDPDVLYAPKIKIEQEVKHIVGTMHGDRSFIFNLGHGIKPDTPYDAVRTLVDVIKET